MYIKCTGSFTCILPFSSNSEGGMREAEFPSSCRNSISTSPDEEASSKQMVAMDKSFSVEVSNLFNTASIRLKKWFVHVRNVPILMLSSFRTACSPSLLKSWDDLPYSPSSQLFKTKELQFCICCPYSACTLYMNIFTSSFRTPIFSRLYVFIWQTQLSLLLLASV